MRYQRSSTVRSAALRRNALVFENTTSLPLAPVGPQAPPTRAAASVSWMGTPRRARVPPVDYGDKHQPTAGPILHRDAGPFLLRR